MAFSKLRYRHGLRDGFPIGLAYLSVSFGFGISAAAKGIGILPSVIISAVNLTSAGQLAGVDIIAAGGTLIEMMICQFVINLRYCLMGLTLTQKLDETFTTPRRMLCSFFITDEIFAVASSKNGLISDRYIYGLGTLPWVGWTLGTLLGAILGTNLQEIFFGIGPIVGALCGWTFAYFRLRWVERNMDIHVFCKGRILKKGNGVKPSSKVFSRVPNLKR